MELSDFLQYTIDPDASSMEALANNQQVHSDILYERAKYKLRLIEKWESPQLMVADLYKERYRKPIPAILGTMQDIKDQMGDQADHYIKRVLSLGFRPRDLKHILDTPALIPDVYFDLLRSVKYVGSYDPFQPQMVRKSMSDRGKKTIVFGYGQPHILRYTAFLEYCKQVARIREIPISLDFCLTLRNTGNVYSINDYGFEQFYKDQHANSI